MRKKSFVYSAFEFTFKIELNLEFQLTVSFLTNSEFQYEFHENFKIVFKSYIIHDAYINEGD